ncbi:MAG: DUF6584 family protein [Bacteroidota bacterium]
MAVNPDKIEQIDREIEAGLISKARSRLEGLLGNDPNETLYREKLGELYYSINWLEKAGEYWFLTKRSPRKSIPIKAFSDNNGNSATRILTVLKFKGDVDKLPEDVMEISRALESESATSNGYVPRYYSSRNGPKHNRPKSKLDGLFMVGCIFMAVAIAASAIVGLITIVKWVL